MRSSAARGNATPMGLSDAARQPGARRLDLCQSDAGGRNAIKR